MNVADYARALGGAVFPYANASNAWKDLLVFLRARAGRATPNVVLPSYLPAKLYRASLAAGCAVRFYEVRGRCEPDLAGLARAVDDDTVAVLWVHYFGFPAAVDDVLPLIHGRGAILVEDCALAMGGRAGGRWLGTFGDAALYSLRKMFSFSEGGLLRVSPRLEGFRPRYERRVSSVFSLRHWLRQRGKRGYVTLTKGTDPLGLFRYDDAGFMDFSRPQELSVKRLSRFSQARLPFQDVAAASERRREGFALVAAGFPRAPGFEPLHQELPEGAVPYSFPFLVDAAARDEHRRRLLRAGVVAGAGWPEAPFDGSPGTAALARSLLELPLHPGLTHAQLLRSIEAVQRLAAGSAP